jgi:SWIM zinc finger
MASTTIARSGQETIPDPTTDLEHVSAIAERVLRGQKLFREHADDFVYRQGAWIIASDTVLGRAYQVRLGPIETCECSDYQYRGAACKHIFGARIAHSKSRVCSCCGSRVLGRFATEVVDEDELLSFFVGDVLCADCIRNGYWT